MRPSLVRSFTTAALACAASLLNQAWAATLPDAEAQKILGVIVGQLQAFAVDDADRAFAAATPAVREAIGTPDRFLALVRGLYPMVYRPASVTFHEPRNETGTVLQFVEIKDDDGKSWQALFEMEQQPDASWRISGCIVVDSHSQSI